MSTATLAGAEHYARIVVPVLRLSIAILAAGSVWAGEVITATSFFALLVATGFSWRGHSARQRVLAAMASRSGGRSQIDAERELRSTIVAWA